VETHAQAAKNKSMKVESQEESLQLLKNHVSVLKLSKTVERNILLAESLDSALPIIGDDSKSNDGSKKKTKPEDLVRIYETLIQVHFSAYSKFVFQTLSQTNIFLQNMTEMAELRGDETEASKDIAAKIQSFKALRLSCFFDFLVSNFFSLSFFSKMLLHVPVVLVCFEMERSNGTAGPSNAKTQELKGSPRNLRCGQPRFYEKVERN
jgi:hypothetical protein